LHHKETLLGAWRASWRLLGVLGNSPTPPWVFSSIHGGFFPFLGLERKMGCELEMKMQMEAKLEHGVVAKNLGRGLASSLWFPFLPHLFDL